jgi:hypothetical protein
MMAIGNACWNCIAISLVLHYRMEELHPSH